MKTFKLAVINIVTLLIGLGLLSGSVSLKSAQAARFETIPAVKVTSLENYRGQYLTVLYAVGSRPFTSNDSSQLSLSQVKDSRTAYITSDSMSLPSVQVEKEGFRPSYNMIVVVVSPSADFGWVNADGSQPQGSPPTNNKEILALNVINKTDVASFVKKQKGNAVLTVDLQR